MNTQKNGPAAGTGETVSALNKAPNHPTARGLLRLHQQACRLAVNAIHRGDDHLADKFGDVILSLEWALDRKGVVV